MSEEAKLTVTLKAGTRHDSPWVVVRAENAVELQATLQSLEAGTVFADIGRVASVFAESAEAQGNLGGILGATGVKPASPTAKPAPRQAEQPVSETPKPTTTDAPATPGGASLAMPGAPVLAGIGPARFHSGTGADGKPFVYYVDPRPADVLSSIDTITDDPNDPGLAAGTKKFLAAVK